MRGGSTPHNGKRSSSDAPSSVRQEDGRLLAESRDSFPDSKGILRILVVRSPLIAGPLRHSAPKRSLTRAELAESREAEATTARHAYESVLASIIGRVSYRYTARRPCPLRRGSNLIIPRLFHFHARFRIPLPSAPCIIAAATAITSSRLAAFATIMQREKGEGGRGEGGNTEEPSPERKRIFQSQDVLARDKLDGDQVESIDSTVTRVSLPRLQLTREFARKFICVTRHLLFSREEAQSLTERCIGARARANEFRISELVFRHSSELRNAREVRVTEM